MAIGSFRHRGLRELFLGRSERRIAADHRRRVRQILAMLNVAAAPSDLDAPGLRLHPLRGRRRGRWAVSVSGNWRITFAFDGLDAIDVDLEDSH